MHPIPCNHCGNNFMRTTLDPEAPRLCNNCTVREEKRNPKMEYEPMTVDILIKCPRQVQIDIEEYCINQGIDFSRYFLELHHAKQDVKSAMLESMNNREHFDSNPLPTAYFSEETKTDKTKGKKK